LGDLVAVSPTSSAKRTQLAILDSMSQISPKLKVSAAIIVAAIVVKILESLS